jgi:outer membrane protein assembly factor BamB
VLDRAPALGALSFTSQSGVVSDGTTVVAWARVGAQAYGLGVAAATGSLLWAAPIDAPFVDSWSTPAIDAPNHAAVFASGRWVRALDLATGAPRWSVELERPIVNASPLITAGLAPANRLFITDYDGFGGAARLYCINIDPSSAANPCTPGQLLWSAPIGGSSGNSPAFWGAGGLVIVASITDESASSGGRVLAFPAGATSAPAPVWVYEHPSQGFFGGVSVGGAGTPAVFAATYALYGGQLNSTLVKLDAATGALVWSTPCGRTACTPVPLPDGRVALPAGVVGFGSAPCIELFRDNGPSATLLWDSALATWNDANSNTVMDPGEYLRVGGWTTQPIATLAAGATERLLAGAVGAGGGGFSPCTDLYVLDLSRGPAEAGFVSDHLAGAGNTPALAAGLAFSIGPGGLNAAGSCPANCDRSTAAPALNVLDFNCFLNAFSSAAPYANCDGSTAEPVLNVLDFNCFLNRFSQGCP